VVSVLVFGHSELVKETRPDEQLPGHAMSTHAIKTELLGLLRDLRPEKKWHKRSGIVELSDYAIHHLNSTSKDPRVARALELAHVMWDNDRT
jgi:hypothetical protein